MHFSKIGLLFNGLATISLLTHLTFPIPAKAAETVVNEPPLRNLAQIETVLQETPENHLRFPDLPPEPKADRAFTAIVSAYTSTPDQTDASPFVAASGKRVHDGMIAANGLPFGTKIKIPNIFGNKIFIVEDRMNPRYGFGHLDIWMDVTRKEALQFGIKRVTVEIFYPKETN